MINERNEKMKKIFLLLSIILFITGCGNFSINYNENTNNNTDNIPKNIEQEKTQIYNTGIPIAKNYIRNKYGFELQESNIDNTVYQTTNPCHPNSYCEKLSGIMNIKTHYQGINYEIEVDTNTYACRDTYEKTIFMEKLNNYFANALNINKNDFTIVLGYQLDENDFLFNTRVTDTNYLSLLRNHANIAFFTYKNINKSNLEKIVTTIGQHNVSFYNHLTFIQAYDYNDYNILKGKSNSEINANITLVKKYYEYITNYNTNPQKEKIYDRVKLDNGYIYYEINEKHDNINITKSTNNEMQKYINILKNNCQACYKDTIFTQAFNVKVSKYCDEASNATSNYCQINIITNENINATLLGSKHYSGFTSYFAIKNGKLSLTSSDYAIMLNK